MNLETYLTSKKIDTTAFQQAEPDLWKTWSYEFEQMHPNSFTLQKLNLINPIRRKYPLKVLPEQQPLPPISQGSNPSISQTNPVSNSIATKPTIPKPVFKPKPKMS